MMLTRGGGVIVNINSVKLAERGVPNATLYCAGWRGAQTLVRALLARMGAARRQAQHDRSADGPKRRGVRRSNLAISTRN